MEKIEENTLTLALARQIAKNLQAILHNKNLSEENKFAQLGKQLPEFATEASKIEREMLNQLDPREPRLSRWWQDELLRRNIQVAIWSIDKCWKNKNELNLVLHCKISPVFFPYLRLKGVISQLQEHQPKATPEKLSEVIAKKEKKRRNKGYLGKLESKATPQVLNDGRIPQRLKKLYERQKGLLPNWNMVKNTADGNWLLKGRGMATLLEFHDSLLLFDRELKNGDCQKMLKLTSEICERKERQQRCQEKICKLRQAYDRMARDATLGMSENELTKLCEKLSELLEEELSLPKRPQIENRQIQLILQEPSEKKLTKKSWLPILLVILIAFSSIWLFPSRNTAKILSLPKGKQLVAVSQKALVAEIVEQGDHYFEQGQYRQAIESYDRAIDINHHMSEVYAKRAKAYSMRRQYEEAVEDYTTALEFNPQMAQACFNRGNVYFSQGWYNEAIEDFNHALDLNPRSAQLYLSRGTAHSKKKQYEQAINDYTNALRLDPKLSQACFNRGNVYFDQGDYRKALDDLDHALELNPNLANAYVIRGTIYSVQSRYDKSIENYNRAIELNPRLPQPYVNRGTDYSRQRRYDLAIEDYNRALKIKPNLVQALVNRGMAYIKRAHYQLAIDDFDRALTVSSKPATIYLNRGKAYLYQGNPGKAALDFNSVLVLEPEREEAIVHLGLAQYQQKMYHNALSNFERAVKLNPALFDKLQGYIELARQADKK